MEYGCNDVHAIMLSDLTSLSGGFCQMIHSPPPVVTGYSRCGTERVTISKLLSPNPGYDAYVFSEIASIHTGIKGWCICIFSDSTYSYRY